MKKAVRAIVVNGDKLLVIKRNKFGKQYYTLPGGGVNLGETNERALQREMQEETGLALGTLRLTFMEQADEPYGMQYVYLADYLGGEPALSPTSDEAVISAMGHNLYEPMWLPIADLPTVPFVSERLKRSLVQSFQTSFPDKVTEII